MERAKIDKETNLITGFDESKLVGGFITEMGFDEEIRTMEYAPLRVIDEAIIRTYPIDVVISHIARLSNFATSPTDYNEKYNGLIYPSASRDFINVFVTNQSDLETIKWKVTDRMQTFGWTYLGEDIKYHSIFPNGKAVWLTYEKKFSEDLTDEVREVGYLYHYCRAENLSTIQKNGLCPKLSRWKDYGGRDKKDNIELLAPKNANANSARIYFFTMKNRVDPEYYFQTRDASDNGENETRYYQLKIDVSKAPNAKFYYDPRQVDAVYTFDNIPPDAISIVG